MVFCPPNVSGPPVGASAAADRARLFFSLVLLQWRRHSCLRSRRCRRLRSDLFRAASHATLTSSQWTRRFLLSPSERVCSARRGAACSARLLSLPSRFSGADTPVCAPALAVALV